jgi:hypothetical protein
MPRRREVLNLAAVTGALSAAGGTAAVQAAQGETASRLPEEGLEDIARALDALRGEVVRQGSFWEIVPVRAQLQTFLRNNGKFPEFIEVGSDVWLQVYDWHVRYSQPLGLGRTADGRYTIRLLDTVVIMRAEAAPGFIGVPFESR